MIIVPIPLLRDMTPIAQDVMGHEVAQFAAGRTAGIDLPAWVIAADRSGAHPVHVYMDADPDIRVQQVTLATALMVSRDRATQTLWFCDTFMATKARGSALDVMPSEDPTAVEALTIGYATHDGAWSAAIPYTRGDDGALTWHVPDLGWKRAPDEIDAPIVLMMQRALLTCIDMPMPPVDDLELLDRLGIDVRPRINPRDN